MKDFIKKNIHWILVGFLLAVFALAAFTIDRERGGKLDKDWTFEFFETECLQMDYNAFNTFVVSEDSTATLDLCSIEGVLKGSIDSTDIKDQGIIFLKENYRSKELGKAYSFIRDIAKDTMYAETPAFEDFIVFDELDDFAFANERTNIYDALKTVYTLDSLPSTDKFSIVKEGDDVIYVFDNIKVK